MTPSQYSSLQILHQRNDWDTLAPTPSEELGEKDLETQKNAMDQKSGPVKKKQDLAAPAKETPNDKG